jgi:biopolymer transport protein TolR
VPRRVALSSLKQISEINLTPLMDLTFILLITFIITFPLIEQGIPVELPQGKAQELSPDIARTITVDREASVYLDDVLVSLADLREEMIGAGRLNPSMMILVRADEHVMYGKVVDVLKILHAANLKRMALVTQAEP